MNPASLQYTAICLEKHVGAGSVASVCYELTKDSKLEVPTLTQLAGRLFVFREAGRRDEELREFRREHEQELYGFWTSTKHGPGFMRMEDVPGDGLDWGMELNNNMYRVWKGNPTTGIVFIRNLRSVPINDFLQIVRKAFEKTIPHLQIKIHNEVVEKQQIWERVEALKRRYQGLIQRVRRNQTNPVEAEAPEVFETRYFRNRHVM